MIPYAAASASAFSDENEADYLQASIAGMFHSLIV